MEACNHSTFSQAIIQSVTDIAIQFDQVTANTIFSQEMLRYGVKYK